jgi:hypothetical protein
MIVKNLSDPYENDRKSRGVLNALFPKIRGAVLKVTLTHPKQWFYLSQLAAELRTSPSALQREIPSLVAAGILQRREDEARVYVSANTISPVYCDLRGLVERPLRRRRRGSLPKARNRSSHLSTKLMALYDREKLYEEAWSLPVQKVAKRYGISGVALAKICRKLRVPVPGRGYWAKLSAGKIVAERPALPPLPKPSGSTTAAPLMAHERTGKVMVCPAGHRTTIPAKDHKRKIVCPTCGQGARSLNYFLEKARQGGLRGGKARAARLSAEQRRESARNAVLARWAKQKNQETATITDIAAVHGFNPIPSPG